ncbi:MAG: hypothetical protein NTX13_23375 [Acidobacteria bacterium]|nr:hypothetical protein [Acidobacteriota bacterium]
MVREADERLAVGEKELAAARANGDAVAARARAEEAKYGGESGAEALGQAARAAERRAAALAA